MVELERKVKCGSCKETFIQKWVVAQKKWSQINEVNYWTDGKGWNDYELLCRSCLKKWFEEYRKDFTNLVEPAKRKMFVNYKTDGVFDKPDHVNQLNKLELSKKKNGENNVEKKLTAAHRGTLDLAGFKLPCFNLEDGRALLASNSVQVALKMVGEDEQKVRGRNLKEFLSQKSLETFVEREKGIRHFDPIVFYDKGVKINGYEAEVLPDICNIYLEARNNIQLAPRQKVIADQCEILIRAFAKVGINALVAEATGYQRVRDDFELQKNLAAYVSEETLEWQKTFHDDFYYNVQNYCSFLMFLKS